uniref:Solute carrier organic anion transporter family member n=1 Tax=Crassostrea virginica TaxID=6565 RepID=A0A8B8DLV5_CRAVI|nr:solute carrier organic anion transporter family member 4A1-like [Crassostrea virginica]
MKETMSLPKEEKSTYGCLSFRPSSLQFLNTVKWYVFWQCMFGFFDGFVVNGVINIIIVALEKRYQLSSQKSGLIASANDFGSVVIYILVGFLGTHANKPRVIGIGLAIMSLGCFVFVMPHFVGDLYQYTLSSTTANSTENLCAASNSSTDRCLADTSTGSGTELYYALLVAGNTLIGLGAVPAFVLGLTYIEENCRTRDSPFYFGCGFACSAVGVAVGFVAGAQTLSIFVDVDKVDASRISLDPSHPQWVGAWWICILVALGGCLLISLPVAGYPKRLPEYDEIQSTKVSEVQTNAAEIYQKQENFGKSIKHLPLSLWLLVKNPAYIFVVLGGTVEVLIFGGLATFGAKIITEFFNTDISEAGYLMGLTTVIGSGGGMLFGGYVVKRFNLRFRGIIRFCCACQLLCMCLGPAFLASCPSQPFAGLTSPYPSNRDSSLISTCNSECGCTTAGFEPVCDHNRLVYFSPCHAGCNGVSKANGTKIYQQCTCVNKTLESVVLTDGRCSDRCFWYYIVVTMLLLMNFLTFSTMSPVLAAMYRCIPHQQRAVGTGIQFTLGRLLGTTPGPVLLGAILDSTCLVWQDKCGERGNCWIYDKWPLGIRLMLWWICTKLVGVFFLCIAHQSYKSEVTSQELKVESKLDNGHGEETKKAEDNMAFTTSPDEIYSTRL